MLGNLGKGGKAPNLGEMHARAIDASTGATIWDRLLDSVPAPIETFREPVSLVGDELWTAYTLLDFTTPAEACVSLARLDPDDGSVLGSESAFLSGSGLVDAGDAVAQDKVGDCDGGAAVALIVRDRTGAVQWTGTVPEPVHSGSNPAIVDGQIFMTDGSRLFAYPRAGCGAATC